MNRRLIIEKYIKPTYYSKNTPFFINKNGEKYIPRSCQRFVLDAVNVKKLMFSLRFECNMDAKREIINHIKSFCFTTSVKDFIKYNTEIRNDPTDSFLVGFLREKF